MSVINEIPSVELQKLLDESTSYADVLRKMGVKYVGAANHKSLKKRIKKDSLSITALNINRRLWRIDTSSKLKSKTKPSLVDVLVENSTYKRSSLKKRLVSEGILKYVCSWCGIKNEWNGKPITLQLDHVNGINDDNRLENLRFLCPNCHSQTDTWGSRGQKTFNFCVDCGKQITKQGTRCIVCSNKKNNPSHIRQKKFEVSKEELEKLIAEKPMTHIGKLFGVSDNAIRKRARLFGLLT